jgi:hypothetical protein
MAQAVKTVEFPFDTRLTLLATATTLGAAAEQVFTAVTVGLPESSKTIRAAWIEVTARDGNATAHSLDGMRIGVQIDAVAFDDGTDLTGTGIANSGDHWSIFGNRDVTTYFTTNYTGTSHTVGIRVRFESSAAANVNNITAKLYVTYEYDDTSATLVKTVKIPLEGNTGNLNTTANTNIRGSAGAAQIPALDTFLPEDSKTYRKIWFELHASDAGAAATDFTLSVAIDSGTNARAALEQALNNSVRFYDIWLQDALVTSTTHDFQAWSSLTNMFQRFAVIMHVTYEFAASSATIMNSLMIPLQSETSTLMGTAAGDQDVFDVEFWIQEPATITMRQSALFLTFESNAAANITPAVSGLEKATGTQGTTTSTYTVSALTQSGSMNLCHRIDLAHGGSAIALARGRNKLRTKIFASVSGITAGLGGYFIINYTSGKATQGIGSHNHTTQWPLCTIYDGTIAGTANREVATTNQRTPNIPQANYFLNTIATHVETNASATGFFSVLAEKLAGEGAADGWAVIDNIGSIKDGEYGHNTYVTSGRANWRHYPNDTDGMNLETARKQRIYGNVIQMVSIRRVITIHAITYSVSGTVSGSSGGTVNLDLHTTFDGTKLDATTRSGNGSYSFTWYDNTENVFVVARESGTLLGRSDNDVAV